MPSGANAHSVRDAHLNKPSERSQIPGRKLRKGYDKRNVSDQDSLSAVTKQPKADRLTIIPPCLEDHYLHGFYERMLESCLAFRWTLTPPLLLNLWRSPLQVIPEHYHRQGTSRKQSYRPCMGRLTVSQVGTTPTKKLSSLYDGQLRQSKRGVPIPMERLTSITRSHGNDRQH